MFIFRNLSVTAKIIVVFSGVIISTAVSGLIGWTATKEVAHQGVEVGERLAPLGDAAMEIKLTATLAHLLFEEIMAGDDGEAEWAEALLLAWGAAEAPATVKSVT